MGSAMTDAQASDAAIADRPYAWFSNVMLPSLLIRAVADLVSRWTQKEFPDFSTR